MNANVQHSVKGKTLTIVIDLDKTQGPSSTGKSDIVATTGGFAAVGGTQFKFALNVIKPRN